MYGDSIDICVVHKPDDLIGEELAVVLGGQIRFSRLGGVQLETFTDPLPQDVQSRVSLHDLSHSLLDQGLTSREPVTIATETQEREKQSTGDQSTSQKGDNKQGTD